LQVIPAIDIINGRCVRLVRGDYDQETVYSDNPVEMALKWQEQGASRLHIVDLDGARMGAPHNIKTVQKIAEALTIPVQLGGGIRTLEKAKRVIDAGVDRVIVGTSVALDNDLADEMFGYLGETAILDVAALNGYVAVRGWQARTEERAVDFAKRMLDYGAKRIIFTDIDRDGMLQGVNTYAIERMLREVNVPVIASGGVGSIEDIKRLAALEESGLEGVILGKALYTGAVELTDALAAV
jgi:phosphoribosylformimino-5-aminoimidazole carboxamide ribotide isomerase